MKLLIQSSGCGRHPEAEQALAADSVEASSTCIVIRSRKGSLAAEAQRSIDVISPRDEL